MKSRAISRVMSGPPTGSAAAPGVVRRLRWNGLLKPAGRRFPRCGSAAQANIAWTVLSSRQVAGIAAAGNGRLYDAENADELLDSLRELERSLARGSMIEEINLETLSPIDRLLIEQLEDADIDVRKAAAQTVRERMLAAAVPALIRLILEAPYGGTLYGDNDRDEAIISLLALAPEKAGPVLGETLYHRDVKVRRWAGEAILEHTVRDAMPAVEERMLDLDDRLLNPGLIDGNWEADGLWYALRAITPERKETIVARLMRSPSRNVKAWATTKVPELE